MFKVGKIKLKHMNKKGQGLKPFVMSIVLVILFTFFIFTFVGLILQEQNPNSEVLSEKYKINQSISRMDKVLDDFKITSDNTYDQMGESEPTAVDFIFLIFKAAFYIPIVFLTFTFNGIDALTNTVFPALGGTGLGTLLNITLELVLASIIITIVLLIVKAARTGEGLR